MGSRGAHSTADEQRSSQDGSSGRQAAAAADGSSRRQGEFAVSFQLAGCRGVEELPLARQCSSAFVHELVQQECVISSAVEPVLGTPGRSVMLMCSVWAFLTAVINDSD